jgi:hypothetical protein
LLLLLLLLLLLWPDVDVGTLPEDPCPTVRSASTPVAENERTILGGRRLYINLD